MQARIKSHKAVTPANSQSHDAGHELEIKFRTDFAGLEQAKIYLCGDEAVALPSLKLQSRYFDTPSGCLRKAGVGLRLRSGERSGTVQTVKSVGAAHGGPFQRRETEVSAVGSTPDISLFDKKSAAFLAKLIGKETLAEQAETTIKRERLMVPSGASSVEISFDDGFAKAGIRKIDIREIELELKSGNALDLYALAIRLAKALPLRLDFSSKAAKAFGLMTGDQPVAIKAKPIQFNRSMTLSNLATAIFSNGLEHFVGNWPAFLETRQPESIHQMRVALRRLRLALALFGRELGDDALETLRTKARHIATALGHVREIDVFRENAEKLSRSNGRSAPDMEPLLIVLDKLRGHAYHDAALILDDCKTTVFALEIQSLASKYGQGGMFGDKETLDISAIHFAEKTLDRLHERVLIRGEHFAKMDAEQRHELRIAFKNLRYAVGFLSGLHPMNLRTKTYLSHVSAIQEVLGAQNDAVMAEQFVEANLAGLGDAVHAGAMAVVKAQRVRKSAGERILIRRWHEFKETEIFWA